MSATGFNSFVPAGERSLDTTSLVQIRVPPAGPCARTRGPASPNTIAAANPRQALDVRQQWGINLVHQAGATRLLSLRMQPQTRPAATTPATTPASAANDPSQELFQQSVQEYRQAVVLLVEVVRQEPLREQAGQELVDACTAVNDLSAMDKTVRILYTPSRPAPVRWRTTLAPLSAS